MTAHTPMPKGCKHLTANEQRLTLQRDKLVAMLGDLLNRCECSGWASSFLGGIRSLDPSKDGPALETARALLAEIDKG